MIHSDSLQYRLDESPIMKAPTKAELTRLAKAHTRAEDALRKAELRAMVAKQNKSKPAAKHRKNR